MKPSVRLTALGMAVVAAAAAAACPALAQSRRDRMAQEERPRLDPLRPAEFACTDGGVLMLTTVTRDAELVAIVQAGDGRHELPLKPWIPGELPAVTWTDGERTLVWSPGVKLTWTSGPVRRDCSRGAGGSHH